AARRRQHAAHRASAGDDHAIEAGDPALRRLRQAGGDDMRTIAIDCLRYNPESDSAPRWQNYEVPFTDEMSVLEGLQYIKDHLDGSLTFRWSCRMAICGSCGAMLNGVPRLGCEHFLRDYYPGPLR